MKIKPEQLTRTLNNEQLPLYWLSGDEPLLMQEAADAIRTHYRKSGFLEREVFNVDRSFDWGEFQHITSNLSLFSEQKIIELRLGSAKLDDAGKKAIQFYLEDPSTDFLILISGPKLDAGTPKTKWFTQIESAGALIQIWPVNRENLQSWLEQRLIREGVQAESQAVALLADKVEGNLLAAMQEIEKIKLLSNTEPGQTIALDSKTVMQVVADSSRFNAFQLVDAAFLGDTVRSQKMLSGLRNEGIFPLVILAALSRELRSLIPMLESKDRGQNISSIIQSARVWFNRKNAISSILGRLNQQTVWELLDHSRLIDQSIKGMSDANPWDELSLLLLQISGNSSVATLTAR